jgi:hypothetical protein
MSKPEKAVDQKQKAEQEKPESQEQGQPEAKEQGAEQKEGTQEESAPSEGKTLTLIQVLDFLKQSNLINLDIPLKSLVEQVQKVQPDPSADGGIIGDSGHWALVWKRKDG